MPTVISRDKLNEVLAARKRSGGEPLPAEWFDGEVREFKRGKDFKIEINSFRSKLQKNAKSHGVTMHMFVIDEYTLMAYAVHPNGKAK